MPHRLPQSAANATLNPASGRPAFYPARVDVVFRRLFGENPRLLRSMLNAVLQPPSPIVRTEILGAAPGDLRHRSKDILLDIRVALEDGTQVGVEMQSTAPSGVHDRLLYYWVRMHCAAVRRGEEFDEVRPSISIIWSKQPLFGAPGFHRRFRVRDQRGHEFCDGLTIHVLELAHLAHARDEGVADSIIRWAKLLLAESEEDLQDLADEDSTMGEASKNLRDMSTDPSFLTLAEMRRDYAIGFLIEKRAERALGRAEGREEGREEGRQEGLAEGRRRLLVSLVERRFGELSAARRALLLGGSAEEIDSWTDALFTASSVDELFDRR